MMPAQAKKIEDEPARWAPAIMRWVNSLTPELRALLHEDGGLGQVLDVLLSPKFLSSELGRRYWQEREATRIAEGDDWDCDNPCDWHFVVWEKGKAKKIAKWLNRMDRLLGVGWTEEHRKRAEREWREWDLKVRGFKGIRRRI
jgi:hypothetical protein